MEYRDFKKKFGQNFIKEPNIIHKIVNSVDITKEDLVIEVGPGSGALTRELARVAGNVLCYEIDSSLEDVLSTNLSSFDNVKVIYKDFLKCDISSDLEQYEYKNLYVVANLPYYITTDIIKKIISSNINPKELVLMVQKEVGDRFSAKPGGREYGSITVLLNYYFNIKKLFVVSRKNFMPEPKVDSVVISLKKKDGKKAINEELFNKLIRDSFKFKRKSLKNNLKGYDLYVINDVLYKNSMNLMTRAESIPVDVFIEISDKLEQEKKA